MTTNLVPDLPQQGVHRVLNREDELARSFDEVLPSPVISLHELLALGGNLLQQLGYRVGFVFRHGLAWFGKCKNGLNRP
jgi:hypothetical protein